MLYITPMAAGELVWDGQGPLPRFQGYYNSGWLNFDLVYPGGLKGHYEANISRDGSSLFDGRTTSNQSPDVGAWYTRGLISLPGSDGGWGPNLETSQT